MLSVVLESPHALVARHGPDPAPPQGGEATVRVLRVGICGTDLHAYEGRQPFMRYPLVPGHELAVEVLEVDHAAADAVAPGDRCTVIPYLSDGTCHACRRGLTNCCANLAVLGVHVDGGLRERMNLPVSTLVAANDVDLDALAIVEMLAVGAHAVRRGGVTNSDDVLVIGAGPIGIGVTAFARRLAQRVAIVEARTDRLAFVAGLGLGTTIDGRAHGDLEDAVRAAFEGDLPTVVFDATGSAASMEGAPTLVARGGRIVFVGHTTARLGFDNPMLHGKELTLRTSRNATRHDFDTVLAALRAGEIDPGPWITHRVETLDVVERLPAWARGEEGVVKALAVFA